MKIRPVGVELFHVDRLTDRQTDGRNSAKSPKNVIGKDDVWMRKIHLSLVYILSTVVACTCFIYNFVYSCIYMYILCFSFICLTCAVDEVILQQNMCNDYVIRIALDGGNKSNYFCN